MILKLINNENTYEFNVTDLNEGVKLYYHFEIPTVDIPDGKYNMQLLDGETVIYEDIVCIGDFKGATIQYKRGDNIYINAPLVGKFEDVTVEITATQTTVYPNDGFDAMTSVVIDATPVYDDGFNSGSVDGYRKGYDNGNIIGYNSGYTDGETVGYNNGYSIGYADGVENGLAEEIEKLPILDITENGEYRTINKGVNVNVIAKAKLQNSLKLGESTFETVPDYLDFSEVTDWSYMFSNARNLKTIPLLDISKADSLKDTFSGCWALITIPQLDTSNVTNFDHTFYHCDNLTSIPQLDTSKVSNMQYTFAYCKKLQSLPAFDMSSANQFTFSGTFRSGGGDSLTDFGGFQNLKFSITDGSSLAVCSKLSYQSCINVLNGLYDFTGNGETPTSVQGQLKVHQNFLDLVGNEISIGTSKGWIITA